MTTIHLQRGVRCEVCGCWIRLYIGPSAPKLCRDCGNHSCGRKTLPPAIDHGNWENDHSGASGSWDAIVRAYEESLP